jgi:hypothetical protein
MNSDGHRPDKPGNDLRTIQQLVNSSEHPMQALERVVDYLKTTFAHYDWIGIYLVQGRSLVLGPWRGLPIERDGAMHRGLALHAAYSGNTEYEAEANELAVPIKKADGVSGVIALRLTGAKSPVPPPEDLALLESVAALVAGLLS